MKRILILLVLVACVWQLNGQTADWEFDLMAVREAVGKAESSLKHAPFGKEPVALLPLKGDVDGVMAASLKTLLTNIGFNCVEGKEDPMWNEIIKEVEWDERKDDILDGNTIVRFGKLQAAKILIYGGVRIIDRNMDRVYAEIDLHATNLTTKQHIWGGTFASRIYYGLNVNGIIALDVNLKQLLKKNFNEARESMQQPAVAGRLANVKTVAVVPLVGDVDQYMTGLALEMLTETSHAPKTPTVPSLLETRLAVRNHSLPCDAVFYGYIRDLNKSQTVYRQLPQEEKVEAVCTYNADIQMFLEDVVSGSVLWSRTVTMSELVSEKRDMTLEELRKALQEQDERDKFKRVILDKAEKSGALLKSEREMDAAILAARKAMASGKWAEVLVYAESVLNRADENEKAAVCKKEAATLKKSAEEKLKAFSVSQIDKEVEEAVKSAREAMTAGRWNDVRLYAEAAMRIAGGSETAVKWRQEAMTLLAQAESWQLDQSLSKVDADIEELLKTARESMKARRLDEADIYAKMAVRMEGGTPKADMLRNEARKLVAEIAAAVANAKVELVDVEMEGMVNAARNAMQQASRLGEALVYAKIAAAMEGGSNAATNLRNEAKKLVEEILGLMGAEDDKDVVKLIEEAVLKAEQAYRAGLLVEARAAAQGAMMMEGVSKKAESLKKKAEALLKQINEALQDEEIGKTIEKARQLFDMGMLREAYLKATEAAAMTGGSDMAKNQRAAAEALATAIKKQLDDIDTSTAWQTYVKTGATVLLCIVGVVAVIILYGMKCSSKNIR